VSWLTRNTKNWHIVYNWLPYSKPIERDALCPDVHVADFQTFIKLKQSCLTSRMEFQYPRYVRTWEYIQINTMTGKNYVTGYTNGGLDGTNAGYNDLFVVKYNSSGTKQWTKQLGTSSDDFAYGVATDS